MKALLIWSFVAASVVVGPVLAQSDEHADHHPQQQVDRAAERSTHDGHAGMNEHMKSMHEGHDMDSMHHETQPALKQNGHDAHAGHAMPPVKDGPWSYRARNNPEPDTRNRVGFVPVGAMQQVSAEKLTKQERCAALLGNPGVMVDRATRVACGQPATTATRPTHRAAPATDHGSHAGH